MDNVTAEDVYEAMKMDFNNNVLRGVFGVCDLGSCQYSNINNMIKFITRWKNEYESLHMLLNMLNIKCEFSGMNDLNHVQGKFIDYRAIKDGSNDHLGIIYECEKIIRVLKSNSFDEIFHALRKSAWDLWTVAECLSIMTFKDLVIECRYDANVYGPVMNQEAQSYGITNAIQCYLFLEHKLIKDIECLKDFDT